MKNAILSSLLLLTALSASAEKITGTVTQFGTSTPLAGIIVAAYTVNGLPLASATSDSAGRYTLNVAPGQYRLLAYDPTGIHATSFYPDAESFETATTLTVQGNISNINFTLFRAGFASGTVRSSSGMPLANMTVAAYNLNGTRRGFTRTDAAGRYMLVLPPGAFKLAAYDEAGAWATTFYSDQATFAAASNVGITSGNITNADFTLPSAARISGTVRDAATGAALANVVVTVYLPTNEVAGTTTTNAGGQYELSLRGGSYRLVFDDPSGSYAKLYYLNAESFEAATEVTAPAGATTVINAAMLRGGRINGNVRDGESGRPIAGATVSAYNLNGTLRLSTTTDAAGTYSLLLPPGDYKVAAYNDTLFHATRFYPGQVRFSSATPLHVEAFTTLAGIDFQLPVGGRLSGFVRDRATGLPLSGITVGAYDLGGNLIASTQSKSDGSWRLLVDAGTYKLIAFDPALRYVNSYLDGALSFDQTLAVTVSRGQETGGLTFVSTRGSAVTGTVIDTITAARVGGITVEAYDSTGNRIASTVSDSSGSFGFALPSGSYRFVASDPMRRYATSFYLDAPSFESSQITTIGNGEPVPSLAFRLGPLRPSRPRGVRRQ